jgi:GTPase SAR1 family protein
MQFLPPQQYENTSVQEYDYLLKFVITGESSVGKSALLLRFSENLFVNTWLATIGVDFKVRNLVLGDKNGL